MYFFYIFILYKKYRLCKKDKIPSGKKKNHLGKTVPHIDELVIDIFGFSRGAAQHVILFQRKCQLLLI